MIEKNSGFQSNSYNQGVYAFKQTCALPTPFELKIGRLVQSQWTILDIGAGNGQFCDFACRQGSNVLAIDALKENQKNIITRSSIKEANDQGRFHFIFGEWPQVRPKLNNLGFDLIFSQSALHYLNEEGRHQAFEAIYQNLNRGGYFALALKSIDNAWMEKRNEQGELVLTKTNDSEPRWHNQIDNSLRTFFTIHRLKQELISAGFNAKNHHFNTRIVSDYEFKDELSVWIEFLYQKK